MNHEKGNLEDQGASGASDLTDHPLTQFFYRLTPESVLDAVEAGGRRCTGRFYILNSFENRVYQLELEDESMVVGKFYRPGRWSMQTIQEEHDFLRELFEEEMPVACPIELSPGQTIGQVHGIYYSLYARVGGRAPQELSDEQVRILGRFLARMHNVGARRDAPHRLRLTPETYGLANLEYLLEHQLIPPEVRDNFAGTVRILLDRIRPLFNQVPTHRLHGDCHVNNLIWTPAGPTFLDFDDMVVGPAVQDLWMLVPSADEEGQRQRRIMLEAYAELRDFSPSWLRLVEPLRALRFIHYATWVAKRFADPIFARTFPHFGTVQYWQRETQDLREQIARMDAWLD